MYLDDKLLKREERVVLSLRGIYERFGYKSFKMSKFEEYDLYAKNKDFLVSDRVITFNDTDGKLLALKPDVTLSIIKNTLPEDGYKSKVYYNENVYRVSHKTMQFKEIMQTGLECIGDVDESDIFEVLYLASESLRATGADFVISLSHMGVISAVFDYYKLGFEVKSRVLSLLKQKNAHEMSELCDEYSLPDNARHALLSLMELSSVDELRALCDAPEYHASLDKLWSILRLVEKSDFADKVTLDFSVVNDTNYYNGIVFHGFIEGIPEVVLFGGEYGRLIKNMGKRGGALGFALYTDLLCELYEDEEEYDVDTLILYDESVGADALIKAKADLLAEGKSFSAQKCLTRKIRFKEVMHLGGDKND